jgi:hypothetical protein
MPTAIYISGLGQSAYKESVEKYAARYIKELQYSMISRKEVPINLNYEIARREKYNLFSFLTLKHITMYQSYWDESKAGQSCTRLIFNKMKELNYFSIKT